MTVVFGLGTRLCVRMRTTFENGVLRNGQQPGSAMNSFIDQGEFEAMKTLSGRVAPRCDKLQFCDKMTVSTWTVFEISLFEQSGHNEEWKKEWEKWQFCNHTLLRLVVFRAASEHLYESCWSQRHFSVCMYIYSCSVCRVLSSFCLLLLGSIVQFMHSLYSLFRVQGPLISITIRPLQYNSLFLITRLAPLETSASQTFTSTELVHKLYLKSRGKLRVLFTAHNVYWVRFSYFRHSACWARRWCFWVQP